MAKKNSTGESTTASKTAAAKKTADTEVKETVYVEYGGGQIDVKNIIADIKAADLQATVARVDNAVDNVNGLVVDVRSENGTLGQLIYNKSLYNHIDATVVSADSLIVDLKAHPKRYVHFSLFGKKDK